MRPWRAVSGIEAATLVSLAVTSLACSPRAPRHEEFAVGMTRSEVTTRFGEPDSTQTLTKTNEAVWGPIEDFWSKVPNGAKVEIWSFDSVMTVESSLASSPEAGHTELYFVNDSNAVDGIGFYAEGAVYESN